MSIGWLTCIPAVLLPHSPCRSTTANAPANRQMPIASVVRRQLRKKRQTMITIKEIEIFQMFNGDIDHFTRVGSRKDKREITDKDWYLLNSLLQDIEIVEKGLSSDDFKKRLEIQLKENFDNEETLTAFKKTKLI